MLYMEIHTVAWKRKGIGREDIDRKNDLMGFVFYFLILGWKIATYGGVTEIRGG